MTSVMDKLVYIVSTVCKGIIGGITLVTEEDILIGKSIISSKMFNKIYEELPYDKRKNVDNIWDDILRQKVEKIKENPIYIVAEP
jgi:hypothetical protein